MSFYDKMQEATNKQLAETKRINRDREYVESNYIDIANIMTGTPGSDEENMFYSNACDAANLGAVKKCMKDLIKFKHPSASGVVRGEIFKKAWSSVS